MAVMRLRDAGHGITDESLGYFERHKSELGEIREVSCRFNDPSGYNVRVVGDNGEMLLSGLNCGYGGEGPHGLHTVLTQIGAENRRFWETDISKYKRISYVRQDEIKLFGQPATILPGEEWVIEVNGHISTGGSRKITQWG